MTDRGYIYLTESGLKIAEMIYERHQVITQIFEKLGVDPETAEKDACKIEHIISEETFDAIKDYASARMELVIK